MKLPRSLFAAGFALASSLVARAEISAQAWLETYYLDPQPAQLTRAIHSLSRQGYFEQPGHVAVAIGFLGTVFAQNPDKVDQWLLELNGLPYEHQRLIACALWQAGHPLGAEMLRALGPYSKVAAGIDRLANSPSLPVADTPVLSLSSMNLQWGAFLASGESKYITNVLAAIGNGEPGLDEAARYALAQNAAAHPRVMEICRAELEKPPAADHAMLRAALDAATKGAARPGT